MMIALSTHHGTKVSSPSRRLGCFCELFWTLLTFFCGTAVQWVYIMRRLIVFALLLLAIPGIAFAQESENQAAEPQSQTTEPQPPKAIQSHKDTGDLASVNAAMEFVYSQVASWAQKFDACSQDASENIAISIQYDCKGKIELLTKTSDCIKEAIPEKFDIDITKNVCVCKEGRISFTYNKSDGITINNKTRIGIVNSNEYCSVYRFKRSHSRRPHLKH